MEEGYLKPGTQRFGELQPPDALGERAKDLGEGEQVPSPSSQPGGAKWGGGGQTQAKAWDPSEHVAY